MNDHYDDLMRELRQRYQREIERRMAELGLVAVCDNQGEEPDRVSQQAEQNRQAIRSYERD